MAEYKIYFIESVEKDCRTIPKIDLQRIIFRIKALAGDPRPPDSEKLTCRERYRIRHGNYRIVYSIQDREFTVWVIKTGHRKDVYR
jgi:mRNA interferase RelE/StbE